MGKMKEVDEVLDGIIEIDGKFYIDQESWDNLWILYGDCLERAISMANKLEELGIDVESIDYKGTPVKGFDGKVNLDFNKLFDEVYEKGKLTTISSYTGRGVSIIPISHPKLEGDK